MNNTTLQFLHRFPKCNMLFHTRAVDIKNKLLPIISASLIPFIIIANSLLIFGIIKNKRNKFTSSQILFLTLFISDLTFSMVQIPIQTYLLWKSQDITCFEAQLSTFSLTFPLIMSGSLLFVISIDRYICILHNNYYKKIVTTWSLGITIVWVILTSVASATFNILFRTRFELTKIAKLYFDLSTYTETTLAISVVLYAALLRNLKQTKNSSLPHRVDSSLAKIIAMILAIEVVNIFQ